MNIPIKQNIYLQALIILLFLLTHTLYSQWLPSVRLTNDTSASVGSYNYSKWIASNGNSIHVVWTDNRTGQEAIYYKRSTDGGSTWGNEIKLNDASSGADQPSIVVSGTNVHVIWDDDRLSATQIFYTRSTNNGLTWENNIQLSNSTQTGSGNSISCEGSFINIVWVDMRHGNAEIYYKSSTDNGSTWSTDTRLTNATSVSQAPSVGQSGSTVHVIWEDWRNNDYEIFYKKSTNSGTTWSSDTIIADDELTSWMPSSFTSGSFIHAAYVVQVTGGVLDVFYKNSTNGGISWNNSIRLTNSGDAAMGPSIVSSNSTVHIVWGEGFGSNFDIYYIKSTNNGISWGESARLTNDNLYSGNPSISASDSIIHVVWNDRRDGNDEIYYKRNNGGNYYTISGLVTYKDNNQPVTGGYVKVLKYNPQTAEIIIIDSTVINSNGTYLLTKVPRDTVDLMFYQDDDLQHFVPTYYVSTIDWREATKIYATQNLTNINCQVYRITGTNNPYNMSGLTLQNPYQGNVYSLKDVIIYAKIGNEYKNYAISAYNGLYNITKLSTGDYTLTAHRMGFAPVTLNRTITNSSLINVNIVFQSPVAITPISVITPKQYSLTQNFPNPFNPSTTFEFSIPDEGISKLLVYDILGREIVTLLNQSLKPGTYRVNWNASGQPSGVYFYRLESGSFTETKKMVLLK